MVFSLKKKGTYTMWNKLTSALILMLRHIEFLTLFSLIREFVDFQISLSLKNFLLFSGKRFPSQYTACMLSHVQLFMISWTVACQAPLSMEARILECVAISFSISILRAWFLFYNCYFYHVFFILLVSTSNLFNS